jgi:vacuolar protein sorting-associated protein 54
MDIENSKIIKQQAEKIRDLEQENMKILSLLAAVYQDLDLISSSQDVISSKSQQNLSSIHCMKHFSSQLSEIEKFTDKLLHSEFSKYIENDLSRAYIDGESLHDKEKLTSLLFAILRIKNSTFIDLLKEDVIVYTKSTIKQTVIEFVSQIDDQVVDEANLRYNAD